MEEKISKTNEIIKLSMKDRRIIRELNKSMKLNAATRRHFETSEQIADFFLAHNIPTATHRPHVARLALPQL